MVIAVRRCRWVCAAVAAGSLWGCGGGGEPAPSPADDRAAVERTVVAYFDALADADGERACAHLTTAMQSRARELGGSSCPEAIEASVRFLPKAAGVFEGVSVTSVAVDGDSATATIEAEAEEYMSVSEDAGKPKLERVDGDWKLTEMPFGAQPNPFAACVGQGLRGFDEGDADPYWKELGRARFFGFVERVCRRLVEEHPGGDPGRREAARTAAAVLRRMIERGELPPVR